MTLASLPTLSVQIAFNPTNLLSTTQTWTDVSQYVRNLSTHGGRQHFLDRIESSTCSLTLDNRDGFFFNGTLNGTTQIIQPRLPIKVTATWSGTPYTVYFGIIESVEEHLADALNSDLAVSCSDLLKYLSLRYNSNPTLYASFVSGTGATNWYKCNQDSGNGTLLDSLGSINGSINGPYNVSSQGVTVYTNETCMDFTASTTTLPTNVIFPNIQTNAIDFWVLGQDLASNLLFGAFDYTGTGAVNLSVNAAGQVVYTDATGATITHPTFVNDGAWHHVAIVGRDSGFNPGNLVVDGVALSMGASSTYWWNFSSFGYNGTFVGLLDSLVLSTVYIGVSPPAYTAALTTAVQNRYVVGNLLRADTNAGDVIAQALVIAGQATVASGAVSAPNFYIDGSPTPYTPNAPGNGTTLCQGQSAGVGSGNVTGSTALDLILQASETETGIFFQADDGTFQFHTKAYVYSATGNAAPTGNRVWADDNNTTYHYDAQSFQVARDDVDVWTTVVVTPQNGTAQTYTNTANIARYGQSTLTKSTNGTTNLAAYQTANYLGNVFASPLPRVANVQLRSETANGANLDIMLGANLQDRITIRRNPINPSAAGVLSTDMVVESINHEFTADPGQWHTNFVLDPYPIRFSTQASPTYFMIADNATYGLADQNYAI